MGQHAVNFVTDMEYDRVERERKEEGAAASA